MSLFDGSSGAASHTNTGRSEPLYAKRSHGIRFTCCNINLNDFCLRRLRNVLHSRRSRLADSALCSRRGEGSRACMPWGEKKTNEVRKGFLRSEADEVSMCLEAGKRVWEQRKRGRYIITPQLPAHAQCTHTQRRRRFAGK